MKKFLYDPKEPKVTFFTYNRTCLTAAKLDRSYVAVYDTLLHEHRLDATNKLSLFLLETGKTVKSTVYPPQVYRNYSFFPKMFPKRLLKNSFFKKYMTFSLPKNSLKLKMVDFLLDSRALHTYLLLLGGASR